jgi:hypothetical protein
MPQPPLRRAAGSSARRPGGRRPVRRSAAALDGLQLIGPRVADARTSRVAIAAGNIDD